VKEYNRQQRGGHNTQEELRNHKMSLQKQLHSAVYIHTASVKDFRQVTISSRINRTISVVAGNKPGFDSRQKELPAH
jgi:hypothetical protein